MSVVVITKNPVNGVCPQCRQVKKFLTSKGVEFEEVIFDHSNEVHKNLIEELGVHSAPIVLPNGVSDLTGWFTGFNINKLRELAG